MLQRIARISQFFAALLIMFEFST